MITSSGDLRRSFSTPHTASGTSHLLDNNNIKAMNLFAIPDKTGTVSEIGIESPNIAIAVISIPGKFNLVAHTILRGALRHALTARPICFDPASSNGYFSTFFSVHWF